MGSLLLIYIELSKKRENRLPQIERVNQRDDGDVRHNLFVRQTKLAG